MAEKQPNKERFKDITDSIEKGIQDLFQSDKYAEYIRTMSRFHKYSANNTMLICMQIAASAMYIFGLAFKTFLSDIFTGQL
ncbi:MAG: hypothetical protein ACI4SS_01315 [Clostridia bacterium]